MVGNKQLHNVQLYSTKQKLSHTPREYHTDPSLCEGTSKRTQNKNVNLGAAQDKMP